MSIVSLSVAATTLAAQTATTSGATGSTTQTRSTSSSKTTRTTTAVPTSHSTAETETATRTTGGSNATAEPVKADTDRDVNDPRAMRLSLDEAVRTTAQRNLGIQIQRYVYDESGYSLRSQYGIFDPEVTGDVGFANRQSPTSTYVSSSRAITADAGLTGLLPTGATYSGNLTNTRGTTNSFGTSYSTGLGLGLSQPLLRNFGIDVTRRGIDIARNTLGINQELFRSVLINTAVSVEQAYLDLVYARRSVDVVKESLFLARDQARITQIRIDVGASAPLDILQPRVQIATTEEQLITAVASVRDAEDRLRALMHLDAADWDRPIIPTDPVQYVANDIDPQVAVARALELRPELREERFDVENARIQYLYARNQVLPRLDLNLGYNGAGIAGRVIDPQTGQPVPGASSTGYTEALRQVIANDYPSWNVGVSFGVPIFNITARAEAKRARLEVDRVRTTLESTRQDIAVDVRKAVRDVDTAARQIAASRTAREAAERNLDAERKRYENGMTTNFNVLQIQQQLSDARVSELQALVGYNKAVANYHRAVGDLLDVRNISVDEPARVDEPNLYSSVNARASRYPWLNYGNRLQGDPYAPGGPMTPDNSPVPPMSVPAAAPVPKP
jgi:HAE1 family hydrophobic/amphiphilic exporter-1